MIQVDEKENIRRLYFIKRHSIREISVELSDVESVWCFSNNHRIFYILLLSWEL